MRFIYAENKIPFSLGCGTHLVEILKVKYGVIDNVNMPPVFVAMEFSSRGLPVCSSGLKPY